MSARLRQRRSDRGFLSIEMLVAVSFSMLFLLFLFNLLFVQYSRGVVRTAADEGARAGGLVVSNPVRLCQTRAEESLRDGIGGFAKDPVAVCDISDDGEEVTADVSVTIEAWLPPPLGQDFDLTGRATSVKEGL